MQKDKVKTPPVPLNTGEAELIGALAPIKQRSLRFRLQTALVCVKLFEDNLPVLINHLQIFLL